MSAVNVDDRNLVNHSRLTHDDVAGIDLSAEPAVQFHQKIRSDIGQERFTNRLNWQSPAVNQDNRIYLPAMPMVIDELTVEFNMPVAATATSPFYIPTYRWISNNGVKLLYKNSVVYTASQAEIEAMFYLDNAPQDLRRKMRLANDDPLRARDDADSAGLYFLDLQCLAKILSKVGPLTAYDANAWSIEIGLKSGAGMVSGSDGDSTAGSVSGITRMSLLLTGHKSSPEFAGRVRQRLNSSGLVVNYLQSNYQRDSSAATSTTITLNQIEGNVESVLCFARLQSVVNGVTTGALGDIDAVANGYRIAASASDDDYTISLGTSANPDLIFGQPLTEESVRLGVVGPNTFKGSCSVVCASGTAATPTTTNAPMFREVSLWPIALSDRHSEDNLEGTSSGSFYFKNDMQVVFVDGGFSTNYYIDTIVYVQRYMLLRSDGVFSNNSY